MNVFELRRILESVPGSNEVKVCVNEPAGWCCPDGAAVDVKCVVANGIDFHHGDTLIVPTTRLNVADVNDWAKKARTEQERERRGDGK